MKRILFWVLPLAALLTSSATETDKQTQFSADMVISQNTGESLVEKLYVGRGRARLDRLGQVGDDRVSTLLIDFDHQLLYLVLPQDKMYLKIMGSNGIYFYKGSYLFQSQLFQLVSASGLADRKLASRVAV